MFVRKMGSIDLDWAEKLISTENVQEDFRYINRPKNTGLRVRSHNQEHPYINTYGQTDTQT